MEFVLEKMKWNLNNLKRGKTRVFESVFVEDRFSLNITMECGNGGFKKKQKPNAAPRKTGSVY